MKTVLDDANTWFFESVTFDDNENELCVTVIGGVREEEPSDIKVGDFVLENTYGVEPTERSRRVLVRFREVAAWQALAELLTSQDEKEVSDDSGFLTILSKSHYLDYLIAHHGWFEAIGRPTPHSQYRLWTEWRVIDVVAAREPCVELLA